LVIIRAGKNNLTQVFDMSLDEDSFKRLNLEATAPYPIVSNTARDACRAPRKLAKMLSDMVSFRGDDSESVKIERTWRSVIRPEFQK